MGSLRLADLVATSARVAATRSRLEKTAALAQLLGRVEPAETPIAVRYLSGDLPQGKIGIGYAAIRRAREVAPATGPALTLSEVDAALGRINSMGGAGSNTERQRALGELFARTTPDEQQFLERLL